MATRQHDTGSAELLLVKKAVVKGIRTDIRINKTESF